MEIYITKCKIDSQWEFAVCLRELKQGLCIKMGRQTGGSFKRERTYVYLWLIHVNVWQKTAKFCKAIILQLKNTLIKKKDFSLTKFINLATCLVFTGILILPVLDFWISLPTDIKSSFFFFICSPLFFHPILFLKLWYTTTNLWTRRLKAKSNWYKINREMSRVISKKWYCLEIFLLMQNKA